MNIQVLYFARVRETLDLAKENVVLPEYVNTVGGVRDFLMLRGDAWACALGAHNTLRMAYNQKMADMQTPVADGGEVAFFPPVTGG